MYTLVIYFTGLLLFVPDPATGRMHVVAPDVDPPHLDHVVQVGTVVPEEECTGAWEAARDTASEVRGVCYHDLDEWSLDFLPGGDLDLTLPHNVLILSERFPGTVVNLDRRRLGLHPTSRVRSRISLGAGSVTDSCSPAEWNFGSEERFLANVVEWTIPDVPASALPLVFQHLGRRGWELWEPRTWSLPLAAEARFQGRIPLIIRHVPRKEPAGPPPLWETAEHFGEFYRLLQMSPAGFLPSRDTGNAIRELCKIGTEKFGRGFPSVVRAPNTYSCMVAGVKTG